MFKVNAMLLTDFYKVGHVFQYPPGTEYVYSNFTPRGSRLPGVDHMVLFGVQYFCRAYLIDYFNENFFRLETDRAITPYRRRVESGLGGVPCVDHVVALHRLGYLPVRIKALPEGTRVPMRVPCLTIVNTDPEFYWVTNFLETLTSCALWQMCTSATLAREYRRLFDRYAELTGAPAAFVRWQGHDFSFRGLSSPETAIASGMAHLTSFTGTDTIPAIDALEYYYGADADREMVGGSVRATEHSVMCVGGQDDELGTFRRLITEVYPSRVVSVVSDTWDLWRVMTEYLPALKDEILNRDGKVVIRPDSGDPVKIVCGDPEGKTEAERKGVVELLWDVFAGSVNERGYRALDPHVGCIYGDGITLDRAERICQGLRNKGFSSENVVFGIGSYTYQANTRDTFGTAIKATWARVRGVDHAIFKCPATDDGTKKSALGLLRVDRVDDRLVLRENVTPGQERGGELQRVFEDGELVRRTTLEEVRERLRRDE